MPTIAFELDDTSLRAAIGQVLNRQFRVTGTIALDAAGSDEQIGKALGDALNQQGVTRGEAIVVVSRWQSEMREVVVPPAPEEELPDLVRFQARSEFVSLTDDWPLDFIPLDQPEGAPQRVLAAAIAPDFLTRLGIICDNAEISLKRIVLRPLSLIELLQTEFADEPSRCRLLVNPYPDHADLSISRGSNLLSTRTIRQNIDATPEKRTSQMMSETRRTLASAKSQSDVAVDCVLIVGDAKRHKSLTGDLSQRLGLEVDFVEPFTFAPLASNLKVPEDPSLYAALLGSLVQESSAEKHGIDFLSPRQVVVLKPDRSRLYLYGGLALAASLLFILFCWRTLSGQSDEIATLKENLAEVTLQNEGNGNRAGVDKIMGEVGAIDQWKLNDVNWLGELKAFSDRVLTPDDAIIDSLVANVGRDEVTLTLRSRVAGVTKETELLRSLSARPYVVLSKRSVADPTDKEYPLSLDFNAILTPNLSNLLDRMNDRAKSFLQKSNAKPAPPVQP